MHTIKVCPQCFGLFVYYVIYIKQKKKAFLLNNKIQSHAQSSDLSFWILFSSVQNCPLHCFHCLTHFYSLWSCSVNFKWTHTTRHIYSLKNCFLCLAEGEDKAQSNYRLLFINITEQAKMNRHYAAFIYLTVPIKCPGLSSNQTVLIGFLKSRIAAIYIFNQRELQCCSCNLQPLAY